MRLFFIGLTCFTLLTAAVPAEAQRYRCRVQPQVTGPIWQIYNGIDPYARTTSRGYSLSNMPPVLAGRVIAIDSGLPAVDTPPAQPAEVAPPRALPPAIAKVTPDREQRSPSDVSPEELAKRFQKINDSVQPGEAKKAEEQARARIEKELKLAREAAAKARDQRIKAQVETQRTKQRALQRSAELEQTVVTLQKQLAQMEARLASLKKEAEAAARKKAASSKKSGPPKPAIEKKPATKKKDQKPDAPKNSLQAQIRKLEMERDKQIKQMAERNRRRAEARIKRLKESDNNYEKEKKSILEAVEKQTRTATGKIKDRFEKKIETLRKAGGPKKK